MEACEKIEAVRAEVIRQRGFASGTDKLQMYASREAGGLDHRHAYQYAAAVLADEIERILNSDADTPAKMAVEAHMRATCVRWGWTGRQDFRKWKPTHLEKLLSEDMIGEAWLLAKIRTGISTETNREHDKGVDEREGPPLWEQDERTEWRTQACRVRVGLSRKGGAATQVTAVGGCEANEGTVRMIAAGIHTWADITHKEERRWLGWKEIRERFPTLGDSDKEPYEGIIAELDTDRWEEVKGKWAKRIDTPEWRRWAQQKKREYTSPEETGYCREIISARRTAECLGGWDLLVDWGENWTPSWVGERRT